MLFSDLLASRSYSKNVSCPPTILMLLVWPQEQVPGARVGGAAVTGVSVVFWEVLVTSI